MRSIDFDCPPTAAGAKSPPPEGSPPGVAPRDTLLTLTPAGATMSASSAKLTPTRMFSDGLSQQLLALRGRALGQEQQSALEHSTDRPERSNAKSRGGGFSVSVFFKLFGAP